MSYGGFPYGGVAYAGSDVAEIPQADTQTALSVEVAFTTDALATPLWEDVTDDVRFWDVQRGRSRELERHQPGRATIVLSNLSRQYDSTYSAGPHFGNIRPMRRVRIRETFNGVTYPVFDGFIDRWHLDYPEIGHDATATVTATDAFKIFARTELPVSVYRDTVLADNPAVYWPLDEVKNSADDANLVAYNLGTLGTAANATYVGPPGLNGEALVVNDPGGSMTIESSDSSPGTGNMGTVVEAPAFSLIPQNGNSFGFELWCIPQNDAGANVTLLAQYGTGGSVAVHTYYTLSNTFVTNVFANATDYSVSTSPTTYPTHARYHIVVKVVVGQSVKMWVNGEPHDDADVAAAGWTDPGEELRLGHTDGSPSINFVGPISHFSAYLDGEAEAIDQAWVDSHYAAGTTPWQGDTPAERLDRILDLANWPSTLRELDAGTVTFQSANLGEQPALEHAQKAAESEYASLLFVTRAGDVRFIGREAAMGREPSPAVYGDGAGEVGYRALRPDDGDETIRNAATISRYNGVAKTAVGATVDEFGRFQYTLDGLLHDSDIESFNYANFVVDEYSEPRRRIVELTVGPPKDGQEDLVYPAMLGPELGDAISVTHTPQGLGDPFEQVCVVEGITHQSAPGRNRTTTFALSPEYSIRALEDEDVATLGYAEVTAAQTGITSETDLTGLSKTVTVGSGRRVRITGFVPLQQVTSAAIPRVLIHADGVQETDAFHDTAANAFFNIHVAAVVTPSAGSHTYKLRASTNAGTLSTVTSATNPAFILVEDIGPA